MINPCRATQRAQYRLCRGLLLFTSRRPNPARAPASLQPVESIHSSGAWGTELVSVCETGLPLWGSPEGNVRRAFSRAGREGNESGARIRGSREVQRPSPRAPDLLSRPPDLRGHCPSGVGRVIGSCRSSRGTRVSRTRGRRRLPSARSAARFPRPHDLAWAGAAATGGDPRAGDRAARGGLGAAGEGPEAYGGQRRAWRRRPRAEAGGLDCPPQELPRAAPPPSRPGRPCPPCASSWSRRPQRGLWGAAAGPGTRRPLGSWGLGRPGFIPRSPRPRDPREAPPRGQRAAGSRRFPSS